MTNTLALPDSQVHLELLWKLRDGMTRGPDLNGLEYFETDPGNTVRDSVDQLVRYGHLVRVTAARYLERQTATQLKEILRANSLNLTCKEADLIARILQDASELPHAHSDLPCGCMMTSYFPGLSTL